MGTIPMLLGALIGVVIALGRAATTKLRIPATKPAGLPRFLCACSPLEVTLRIRDFASLDGHAVEDAADDGTRISLDVKGLSSSWGMFATFYVSATVDGQTLVEVSTQDRANDFFGWAARRFFRRARHAVVAPHLPQHVAIPKEAT